MKLLIMLGELLALANGDGARRIFGLLTGDCDDECVLSLPSTAPNTLTRVVAMLGGTHDGDVARRSGRDILGLVTGESASASSEGELSLGMLMRGAGADAFFLKMRKGLMLRLGLRGEGTGLTRGDGTSVSELDTAVAYALSDGEVSRSLQSSGDISPAGKVPGTARLFEVCRETPRGCVAS